MQSLCIKTNSINIINYLIEEFSKLNLDNLIISSKSFKVYDNVIIHYLSSNNNIFFDCVSIILSNTIIKFYEPVSIKKELNKNFLYFSNKEKKRILELYLNENKKKSHLSNEKYNLLYFSIFNYITKNHSIILNGFYNFRLYNYHQKLSEILDISVNNYLIEREYFEFINILKLYINSNYPLTPQINLIFLKKQIKVLDCNNNILNIKQENSFNAKFLSDISFSENDYILNYLLNALPRKIIIHISKNIDYEDDFLNTLKLIFENKIEICTDCTICSSFFFT